MLQRADLRGWAAALFVLSFLLWWSASAWAASVETSHTVTVIVVPPSLSFSEETSDAGDGSVSSLTFDEGAASAQQLVNYRVTGNSFSTGPVPGLVTASVESPEGIQISADLGRFTNEGTAGNIELYGAVSGEQVIGSLPVELAAKDPTTGPQAEVLNGTLPVRLKATATQDLSSGNYPVTLTVTLKDS